MSLEGKSCPGDGIGAQHWTFPSPWLWLNRAPTWWLTPAPTGKRWNRWPPRWGELGRKGLPLLADVGDREQLETMLETALAEFGRLDVVVNNAATRPHKPFPEMTYDDWRGVLATDLDSAFITTKAALPGMLERGWGRVVNLSGLQAFPGTARRGAHIGGQGGPYRADPRAGDGVGAPAGFWSTASCRG